MFVVEDLVIEGLTPADRPFLDGEEDRRQPAVVDDLHAASSIIESIEMTDWDMVVETFPAAKYPNGRHNFPKFVHERKEPKQAEPVAVHDDAAATCSRTRGQFTYDDHGTPWSTVGAQPARAAAGATSSRTTTAARRRSANGTIQIQAYEPFRANMQSRFAIDGAQAALRAASIS